ncbi:ABC transporter substrate-binding protein, partial [Mycobacterium tuberculosis]
MTRRALLARAAAPLAPLALAMVLASCGHSETLGVEATPTLPLPTPVGMEIMPPQP